MFLTKHNEKEGRHRMKISEVIKKIKANHSPLENEQTYDTIKYGDSDKECTGIVVTCFASVNAILEAAKVGANLIVCHENAFYHTSDDLAWLKDNKVFNKKKAILDEYGIVLWRYFDHIRAEGFLEAKKLPDIIYHGIMEELGWNPYLIGDPDKPAAFKIPKTPAKALAAEIIDKLNLNGLRIMGDENIDVSTVLICGDTTGEHGRGQNFDPQVIKWADENGADLLITFEMFDWTVSEYVCDTGMLGLKKVLFNIGRFNMERLGMKYVSKLLPSVVGGDVPITFYEPGDTYTFIV